MRFAMDHAGRRLLVLVALASVAVTLVLLVLLGFRTGLGSSTTETHREMGAFEAPSLGKAVPSGNSNERLMGELESIYAPRSWRDALHEAATSTSSDALAHERQAVWAMVRSLCGLDWAIERGTSQRLQRALQTAEGRQSMAVVKDVAAIYCDGFDEALAEAARIPFVEPLRPVIHPGADIAAALAKADTPTEFGNTAAGHLDRAVLPEWEREAGMLALSESDQRRVRRVAALEASCTIFPLGCGPTGLSTIAECSFDHRCRPGATAQQVMADRLGLDGRQRVLAIGLGQAMAADYAVRRRPSRGG